jgi:Helitron helicase-like domain at N-terminus
MTPRLTQSWWYRFRLLHEERFQQWSHLTCEYLVDMFSRIEEERLEYIRNGRQMQARDLFLDDEGGGTIEDDQDKELERLFLGTLPSTFLGSRAWISENVANALAICRDLGNPSLFITMTTNPKWPEIVQELQPG